jgi:hypothetical protein
MVGDIDLNNFEKTLKKLDRPPAGPNFVRLLAEEPLRTAKNIVSLVLGIPPFSYKGSYGLMRDRITFRITLETALKGIEGRGSPIGRKHNRSLLRAFFEWEMARNYSSLNPIGFEQAYYRISRDILVPIDPLAVIREKGKFTSIFACGWNNVDCLGTLQRRFLRTMTEDAFLSLTDYQDGEAEFLFFPKMKMKPQESVVEENETDPIWVPEVWQRNDYDMLSKKEMTELVQVYLEGRSMARDILHGMAESGKFSDKIENENELPVQRQRDLFD